MEIRVVERFQSISRKKPKRIKITVKQDNYYWKKVLGNYRDKNSDDERIEKD
ncbi:unnamed protein product [marine sediment metagenome]|uniref:Uncharacterized protein n=1 Tax=marine sediment metagenome TaxID=412755 RepID=X1MWX2_9ZZZZ